MQCKNCGYEEDIEAGNNQGKPFCSSCNSENVDLSNWEKLAFQKDNTYYQFNFGCKYADLTSEQKSFINDNDGIGIDDEGYVWDDIEGYVSSERIDEDILQCKETKEENEAEEKKQLREYEKQQAEEKEMYPEQ